MKKIYSCVNHTSRLIALFLFTVGQLSLAGTDPANKIPDRKASFSKRGFARQTLQKTATSAVGTDPIRFTLKADKQAVAPGEEVTLTITATDLNINSALLFTFAEAKAFRLKVLMPKSFIQIGGDYTDCVGATGRHCPPKDLTLVTRLKGISPTLLDKASSSYYGVRKMQMQIA